MTLTKTQRIITATMLDMAADEFANHSCNDYVLPNSPENIEFVRGMIAAGDYPSGEPQISKDGKLIYLMDFVTMRYCRELVLKETL